MKIMISWSGERSKIVGESLRKWLPEVFQAVEPWISESDISPGIRWGEELAIRLDTTDFGIICLTPENIVSPWILFEAGALSKSLKKGRVIPYLIALTPKDLGGPLAQFQAVKANKEGTRRLINAINSQIPANTHTGEYTNDNHVFKVFWNKLKKDIDISLKYELNPSDETKQKIHSLTRRNIVEYGFWTNFGIVLLSSSWDFEQINPMLVNAEKHFRTMAVELSIDWPDDFSWRIPEKTKEVQDKINSNLVGLGINGDEWYVLASLIPMLIARKLKPVDQLPPELSKNFKPEYIFTQAKKKLIDVGVSLSEIDVVIESMKKIIYNNGGYEQVVSDIFGTLEIVQSLASRADKNYL